MAWAYEGNEGWVPARRRPGYVALYRLWREPHHAYTVSRRERDRLARQGWAKEGVAAWVATARRPGTRPLYRLFHPGLGDTLFTVDPQERARQRDAGYRDEGRIGWVHRKRAPGYQPFYRAWDPARQDHLYSQKVATIDAFGPTLTRDELERALRAAFGRLLWPRNYTIELADDAYYCPSEAVARKVIRAAGIDRRRYIAEIFDCDDFAHLLKSAFIENVYDSGARSMPYAMGIVWGNRPPHAVNFVALSEGGEARIRIVEPQDGRLHEPARAGLRQIYLLVA